MIMKILQVNCVYNRGSTGKIAYDIHTELLSRGHQSVVCYGRGARTRDPGVYKTCSELYSKANNLLSRFTGLMYGGCFFSTNRLISVIKKEAPDLVHLHCINGYFVNVYRLIRWLNKHRIKTVLTLHAELMHTGNCGHALDCDRWKVGCGKCPRRKQETGSLFFDGTARSFEKMRKAFEGFETLRVIAVSDWIAGRARQSAILADKQIATLYNGIRTECFCQAADPDLEKRLRETYGLEEDRPIILHVTPSFYNPVKGGKYFAALAEQLPPEYQCVVVGSASSEYSRITFIPFLSNQTELAAFYRMAKVMVITSKCDNYPTVCLEANCCGTPVVGFDVGGIRETIFAHMGTTVPFGDLDALTDAVVSCAAEKDTFLPETAQLCQYRNSKERMAKDYLEVYEELLEELCTPVN